MKHTATIAAEERLSGSEGEAKAVEYFRQMMEGWGYETKVLWIENYISLPISGSLTVLSPEQKDVRCITHSFSITTPPGGLEAELVYLPAGSDMDIRGKIVVQDGLAAPGYRVRHRAEGRRRPGVRELGRPAAKHDRDHRLGTAGAGDRGAHPEDAGGLHEPGKRRVPEGAVRKGAGEGPAGDGDLDGLQEGSAGHRRREGDGGAGQVRHVQRPHRLLASGRLRQWHRQRLHAGDGEGPGEAQGRAARGVRFIWWSGHSHGRYSGSNWYADYNWEDLNRNAVVNLNVDSLGCVGATDYSEVECSAELYDLGREVIQKYTGQRPHYQRIGRSGDQSFWGIGLPGAVPVAVPGSRRGRTRGYSSPAWRWFWHTEADTIDKIDRDILLKDTQIYMATLWRLCTAPVLPLNYVRWPKSS